MVPSRKQARQMILHGHFTINGKKVTVPSFNVVPGQEISVRDKSKKLVKELIEANPSPVAPNWMTVDLENLKASVVNAPSREDLDPTIKEALIVEYYSR
jgi:small subunit ribosomal protein S4